MKNLNLLLMMLFVASFSFAQNAPINFETGGQGANWTWTVFENSPTPPPLEFVANPQSGGINTSATVAKFTALQAGQPWAGCESLHGADLGAFVLDATNCVIKIMVYKTVISDVAIKLVANSGWALSEIKVANTVVNQWEELTFDFSAYANPPSGDGPYDQIVVFPDFNLTGRTQDNIIFFDNITFNASGGTATEPTVAAPVPTHNAIDVLSIFSNTYTNVEGTDFNPGWGQSTIYSVVEIEGNQTIKYANFNYQGTQFASALDVTEMEYLHVDMWTADATSVNIFCISTGPVEFGYALPITPNEWVSYNIPLSAFTGVNMEDVIQFKFDGGTGTQTIYLDNIYFHKAAATPVGPTVAAPAPTHNAEDVMSIFSNTYTNIPDTDFNPGWGQSTIYSVVEIEGNQTIKYANFNYQGTQFASALDVTEMEYLHVDMWTADATSVNIFCISTGPVEFGYALPITPNEWVSYNIPLSAFTGVNMADVIQFKFDGGTGTQTIYLDNIYFNDNTTGINDVTSNQIQVYPNPATCGTQINLSEVVKQVVILDLSGKIIMTLNSTSVINTENLRQGFYIVNIKTQDNKIKTQKLIIN